MMPTIERGRSFDAWAGEYDRYRPTYPDALFALIARELGLRKIVAQMTVDQKGAAATFERLGFRRAARPTAHWRPSFASRAAGRGCPS